MVTTPAPSPSLQQKWTKKSRWYHTRGSNPWKIKKYHLPYFKGIVTDDTFRDFQPLIKARVFCRVGITPTTARSEIVRSAWYEERGLINIYTVGSTRFTKGGFAGLNVICIEWREGDGKVRLRMRGREIDREAFESKVDQEIVILRIFPCFVMSATRADKECHWLSQKRGSRWWCGTSEWTIT